MVCEMFSLLTLTNESLLTTTGAYAANTDISQMANAHKEMTIAYLLTPLTCLEKRERMDSDGLS